MAMKSTLFFLACVVADNVLECFAEVKAESLWFNEFVQYIVYESSVAMKKINNH